MTHACEQLSNPRTSLLLLLFLLLDFRGLTLDLTGTSEGTVNLTLQEQQQKHQQLPLEI